MTALDLIGRLGVVPVVVIDDPDAAAGLGDALLQAGLPCAEVTLRTPGAIAAIEVLAADPALTVGAGTVVGSAQVDQAVKAGARFIVTPGIDPEVVSRCRELGVPVIPGIATATEAMAALRQGVNTVKLFPAQALGGLEMLTALGAPFPSLRFVPTGGIQPAQLHHYVRHPSVLAVGGSWITPRELLAQRRFAEISRLAADAVGIVTAVRQAERSHA